MADFKPSSHSSKELSKAKHERMKFTKEFRIVRYRALHSILLFS